MNDCSSDEMLDSLLLIDSGIFCMVLLGLEKGWNVPLFKLRVTSRKFTTFIFASILIVRLWLRKNWVMSFLMVSMILGVCLKTSNPSSLYRPMLSLPELYMEDSSAKR